METPIKFPSIEQFRNVRRNVEWQAQFQGLDALEQPIMNRLGPMPTLPFIGTVKIHGCNAGVVFENGTISCQSRERVITPESDNYGFARFIDSLSPEIKAGLSGLVRDAGVLYFEWCGQGIQNKVAVCEVPKMAVLIAAADLQNNWLDIQGWSMPNSARIFNIFQFGHYVMDIDFQNPGEYINKMNEITLQVEKECPVGRFFGVTGVGEGVVWAPADKSLDLAKFAFKVKGSEHSGSKVTKLATVDVEKVKNLDAFVSKHVHEGRLMQAWNHLAENKLEQTEKSTGVFLRWLMTDVLKEERDELVANGFNERDLAGALNKAARLWFFHKIQ